MPRKMSSKVFAIALVALGCVGLGVLTAQSGQDEDDGMQAMMKAATPGEHHGYLKVLEGDWDIASRIWMAPGAPPSEEKATASYRWLLDGRYLQEEFNGEFSGMPFKGINLIGYDNVMGRYQSIWFDSMSTGMAIATGKAEQGGKRLVFEGETPNPMTGGITTFRIVHEIKSDNRMIFEYFEPGPDGAERKSMEMVYTRRGKAGGTSPIR